MITEKAITFADKIREVCLKAQSSLGGKVQYRTVVQSNGGWSGFSGKHQIVWTYSYTQRPFIDHRHRVIDTYVEDSQVFIVVLLGEGAFEREALADFDKTIEYCYGIGSDKS